MSENPYAAPESAPKEIPVVPLAIPLAVKNIRKVANALRLIGWIAVLIYLPMSLGASFASLAYLLTGNWNKLWEMLLATGTCCGVLFLGWTYLRVGKGLLTQRPHAYRAAMVLLCLLLLGFPFLTLVGVLCIVKLYRYYTAFCELPETADLNAPRG